ncbi:caspase family protein [Flammeovirga aprica]|uniref:Caspase family protein n=1 Tax=Flammeovirga aprica JL-4 TaxID=694437 RepID=A0A7X9XC35_9BACT|nr:caspase family protein [Flammeovirga aprica]NME71381.1 caspase family protein [Flammeovirga aprica JL-4]
MKLKNYFLFFCLFTICQISYSSGKKALLIGIDHYIDSDKERYAEWQDLDGAVNDATVMYNLLKSKYGFSTKDMTLLTTPKTTTKKSIVKAFNQLIKAADKGDQICIYYAGHGAQIQNSKFYELDKKHEAIVPSDVLKTNDFLLDVEINALLNRILDKDAELTVIFDNCFSGSGTRGAIDLNSLQSRYVPISDIDIDQVYKKQKSAAERGALVVSAAKDYQLAKEYKDNRGQSHGVFTYALMKAMQMSAVNESAEDIFKRVNSIILYNAVPRQDPVIEGSEERMQKPLFGGVSDPTMGVQVGIVDAENKYKITLDGGSAVGIVPGTQLTHETKGVVVEVTALFGVNGCYGKVIQCDKKLTEGDLVKVTKWAPYNKNRLKVHFGEMGISDIEINALKELSILLNDKGLLEYAPYEEKVGLVVRKIKDKWKGFYSSSESVSFGHEVPSFEKLEKLSSKLDPSYNKIYIEVPPGTKVYQQLNGDLSGLPKVEPVKPLEKFDYRLIGRFNEKNELEYSWVRYAAQKEEKQNPLPAYTDWVAPHRIFTLTDYAGRLGELKGWLTMEVPPNSANFPFKFALKKNSNGDLVKSGGLVEGEEYGLALYKDKNLYNNWNMEDRYLFIFLLTSDGSMKLLFPTTNSSVENNTEQIMKTANGDYKDEILIGHPDLLSVSEPFTTDNILILSTVTDITDTSIFNQDGVVTRGSGDLSLDELINEEEERSSKQSNWFLERHTFFGTKTQ